MGASGRGCFKAAWCKLCRALLFSVARDVLLLLYMLLVLKLLL